MNINFIFSPKMWNKLYAALFSWRLRRHQRSRPSCPLSPAQDQGTPLLHQVRQGGGAGVAGGVFHSRHQVWSKRAHTSEQSCPLSTAELHSPPPHVPPLTPMAPQSPPWLLTHPMAPYSSPMAPDSLPLYPHFPEVIGSMYSQKLVVQCLSKVGGPMFL